MYGERISSRCPIHAVDGDGLAADIQLDIPRHHAEFDGADCLVRRSVADFDVRFGVAEAPIDGTVGCQLGGWDTEMERQ